jgi:hypothetical protein
MVKTLGAITSAPQEHGLWKQNRLAGKKAIQYTSYKNNVLLLV